MKYAMFHYWPKLTWTSTWPWSNNAILRMTVSYQPHQKLHIFRAVQAPLTFWDHKMKLWHGIYKLNYISPPCIIWFSPNKLSNNPLTYQSPWLSIYLILLQNLKWSTSMLHGLALPILHRSNVSVLFASSTDF